MTIPVDERTDKQLAEGYESDAYLGRVAQREGRPTEAAALRALATNQRREMERRGWIWVDVLQWFQR